MDAREKKQLQRAINQLGKAIDSAYEKADPLTLSYADRDSEARESLAHVAATLALEPYEHTER